MKYILNLLILVSVLALGACRKAPVQPERSASMGSIFKKKVVTDSTGYDLTSILKGGELIITTISSPQTYYDYHGVGMGLQYALAENFAESQGLTIRVEVVSDTLELVKKLQNGEADVIAYPLSENFLKENELIPAGYNKSGRWGVRKNAQQLADAMNDWYGEGIEIDVNKALEEKTKKSHHIERKAQAVYLSRERGVISVYDNLFKNASSLTGWDWKLIAAQCYQESAFDPNARSYVGARGLMQLMPKTAKSLGLEEEEICQPDKNVDAASRHIAKLDRIFSDVKDRNERIKFVLAAYNGGQGHLRDAMALAKKYGHNPHVWDEVAPYVLALSQPEFYKDPAVKYGYMIGRETTGYVQNILERWRDYGGNVAITGAPHLPASPARPASAAPSSEVERRLNAIPQRSNRYTTNTKVMRPDDPRFNQMEE